MLLYRMFFLLVLLSFLEFCFPNTLPDPYCFSLKYPFFSFLLLPLRSLVSFLPDTCLYVLIILAHYFFFPSPLLCPFFLIISTLSPYFLYCFFLIFSFSPLSSPSGPLPHSLSVQHADRHFVHISCLSMSSRLSSVCLHIKPGQVLL